MAEAVAPPAHATTTVPPPVKESPVTTAPPPPVAPPATTAPPPVAPPTTGPPPEAFAEEKSMVPPMDPEEKHDDSKALALAEQNPPKNAKDRDAILARVETDKRTSLIKAWEENEKSKADNKFQKKVSATQSWENTKKAAVEAQLRKMEEKLDRKKAEYAEKMRNKVAMIHKGAEEKRAHVHALRGQEMLKAEEEAAKYRAKGETPRKGLMCFGC